MWFEAVFCNKTLEVISYNDLKIAKTLQSILQKAKAMKPDFDFSAKIKTNLEFPRNWGLGSSSTLINNIAQWVNVNAFELLSAFGGSGYDIACAQYNKPIIYQLEEKTPLVSKANFKPSFAKQLFFVYRNKKQDSKAGIKQYRELKKDTILINDISALSLELAKSNSLTDFDYLLKQHESIIGNLLGINPVQQELFKDYFGQLKSLGAWGGDFMLATGNDDTIAYFKAKGYGTVIPFSKMIL